MARQNRVLPTGEIVADPARGMFMGNRGILHDRDQRLGAARWRHKGWVCCALSFKGRHRKLMQPGQYTELFFLDEAVALAAGHRPCAECRRADFNRFRSAWAVAHGTLPRAPDMDRVLHASRAARGRAQMRHQADARGLPDGAFVLWDSNAHLLLADRALPFTPGGYGAGNARPVGMVTVLTPAPTLAALAAGYAPLLHPSALVR